MKRNILTALFLMPGIALFDSTTTAPGARDETARRIALHFPLALHRSTSEATVIDAPTNRIFANDSAVDGSN